MSDPVGKRYQVFLSSTFIDLVEERQQVTQALLKTGRCIPAGMELFGASTLPPWDFITRVLDVTGYFVLVIKSRYGSTPPGGQRSYTELEYEYAVDRGIPVLAFVAAHDRLVVASQIESIASARRALAAFRKRVEKSHTVTRWSTPQDLSVGVTDSLWREFETSPRPGWIRGSSGPGGSSSADGAGGAAGRPGEAASERPVPSAGTAAAGSADTPEDALAERLADVTPLLRVLATGVWHDRAGAHTGLWVEAVQRLLQARSGFEGIFQQPLEEARDYPALLALRACGLAAIRTGRDGALHTLMQEPKYRDRNASGARVPAVHALHDMKVLDPDLVNRLPRWNGQKWLYPLSHLVREDLREPLRDLLPDDDDYRQAFDAYEYRAALLVHVSQDVPGAFRAGPGEYVARGRWRDGRPEAEREFAELLARSGYEWGDWPWSGSSGARRGGRGRWRRCGRS